MTAALAIFAVIACAFATLFVLGACRLAGHADALTEQAQRNRDRASDRPSRLTYSPLDALGADMLPFNHDRISTENEAQDHA